MSNPRIAIITLLGVSLLSQAKDPEAYARTVSVKSLLKTSVTSEGKPLSFPADTAEVDGLEVTIPAGSSTGWHSHSHSGFGYVLSGRLQVTTADSVKRVFGPGEGFAEVVGTSHEGTALGKDEVKLVAFFLVQKGRPVSIKR